MATQTNPETRDTSPPQPGGSKQRRTPNPRTTRQTGTNKNKTRDEADIEVVPETLEPQGPSTEPYEGPIKTAAFPIYKLYRRQHVKLTTARHHAEFLSQLKAKNQIPKGLKPKVTVTNAELPRELYIRWEAAHIELAHTLQDILIAYWEDTIIELDLEVNRTSQDLTQLCSPEEMTTIHKLIEKANTDKVTDLKQRRDNKIKNQPKRSGPADSAGGSR